jgi:carbonic anhydrase
MLGGAQSIVITTPFEVSDMITFPQRLIAGYRDFAAHRLPAEQTRYRELSEHGQSPEIMMIGCCDSRVSPEVIFDAHPGEIFVVRNIANLVPPYAPDGEAHGVSAALEFGVQVLQVKHIVVMGHAQCGGVKALTEENAPLSPGDFIGRWMSLIEPDPNNLKMRSGETHEVFITRLERAVVKRSLQNLMTFPFIRARVENGSLLLHGAHFGVAKGDLHILDKASGEFRSTREAVAV